MLDVPFHQYNNLQFGCSVVLDRPCGERIPNVIRGMLMADSREENSVRKDRGLKGLKIEEQAFQVVVPFFVAGLNSEVANKSLPCCNNFHIFSSLQSTQS